MVCHQKKTAVKHRQLQETGGDLRDPDQGPGLLEGHLVLKVTTEGIDLDQNQNLGLLQGGRKEHRDYPNPKIGSRDPATKKKAGASARRLRCDVILHPSLDGRKPQTSLSDLRNRHLRPIRRARIMRNRKRHRRPLPIRTELSKKSQPRSCRNRNSTL